MLRMLSDIKKAIAVAMGVATLFLFHPSPAHADGCLKYEPEMVTLTGTVIVKRFPGPPEYSSIEAGDRTETVTIIKLDRPICVNADSASAVNTEAEEDVAEIQIGPLYHLLPGWPKQFKRLKSKKAKVAGTLFHRHTGHHRTAILMDVKELDFIENKND